MPESQIVKPGAARWLGVALGLSVLGLSCLAAAAPPELSVENEAWAVSVAESRQAAHQELAGHPVQETVFAVRDKTWDRTRELVWGGAQREAAELTTLVLDQDRLVPIARLGFGVLDLRTGEELAFTRSLAASPSPDGGLVAYKSFVPRFVPPEAEGDVVVLFEVASLTRKVVFPESDLVSPGPGGELLAWQPDPAERYHVSHGLYWSPDGDRLAFFAKTGVVGRGAAVRDFVGVVELAAGLQAAKTTLVEISPESYLRPGAEVGDDRILFDVDSVEWRGGRLEVRLPESHWWARETVTIDLP